METQEITLSSDYCISLLLNDHENLETNQTHLSSDKYTEELQLQEAIIVSFITLQRSHDSWTNITEKASPMEVEKSSTKSFKEVGESSNFLCEICAERKYRDQMFRFEHSCIHQFCTECISKYISIKLNQGKNPVIKCPGLNCEVIFEMDKCGEMLPKNVARLWGDVLCESMILPWERFYCPFKSCSALLVKDSDDQIILEAECPFCRRLFCAECLVPWHTGVDCKEFMKLGENERGREDLIVHELAKKNKWQRCPKCKYFVQKSEGCLHMTCRCGFEFCYACGAKWSSGHGGCR